MSHDKYRGYYCLSWTCWIFIVLALGIIGVGFVAEFKPDLIPVVGLERYSFWIKVLGGVLAAWAFLGVCSSCGGCLIFFFSIASGILAVTFLVLGGISTLYCFKTMVISAYISYLQSEDGDGRITNVILTQIETWVQTSESVSVFNETQYLLNCCGFDNYQKTHPDCSALANCRDVIQRDLSLIFEILAILCAVFVVFFLFLCIPACIRMKSFTRFPR